MWLSYPPRGGVLTALAVLFATIYDSENPISSIDPAHRPVEFAGKSDAMSALQGIVHLEPLQATAPANNGTTSGDKGHLGEKEKLEDKAPATPLYILSELGHIGVLSLQETLKQVSSTKTSGIGVTAMVLIALLLICTCIGAFSIAYPDKVPRFGDRHYAQSEDEGAIVRQRAAARAQSEAARAAAQSQEPPYPPSGPIDYFQHGISPFPTAASIQSQALMTQDRTSHHAGNTAALDSQDVHCPPPLCPSLVMPLCKALFGLAMFELAEVEVAGQGEVTILGPSGRPLLRGVVRKAGDSRTLEISMLEGNDWGDSRPRATITPTLGAMAGNQQGVKALEIRGMRGVFYGTLEMQSSGECYVMRDGLSVLKVDGDTEGLQLSLTSGLSGQQVAAVRCSDESLARNDHVEIVVEAGVDTVLCLSVVLAVLLLSPYLKDK